MAYLPIEDYGIIGDMHTAALVGKNGSIDWFCYPFFDSPSIFGAILDDKKGGRFRIYPACDCLTQKQLYWPETNVLITRFLSAEGVAEVFDFMLPSKLAGAGMPWPPALPPGPFGAGGSPLGGGCQPAFNYARDEHQVGITPEGATFQSPGLAMGLATRIPLSHLRDRSGR